MLQVYLLLFHSFRGETWVLSTSGKLQWVHSSWWQRASIFSLAGLQGNKYEVCDMCLASPFVFVQAGNWKLTRRDYSCPVACFGWVEVVAPVQLWPLHSHKGCSWSGVWPEFLHSWLCAGTVIGKTTNLKGKEIEGSFQKGGVLCTEEGWCAWEEVSISEHAVGDYTIMCLYQFALVFLMLVFSKFWVFL